jgi:hypothetical protein
MPKHKHTIPPTYNMFGGDETTINQNMPKTSSLNGETEGLISKIFNGLFLLISVLLCLTFLIIMIVSIANIMQYRKLKRQHDNAQKSNQIIIKNTLDYKLLSYTEGIKSEPLLIKTVITLTNIVFILIGSYVLLLCVEFGILLGLGIYSVLKGEDTSSLTSFLNIKFDKTYAIIVSISLVGAFILYNGTKSLYTEKTLPSLLNTKMMFYNLKKEIIPNLYIDVRYLEALRNDDIEQIKTMVKKKAETGDTETTAKMIFTYNVYNHYQNIFTISDSIREEIKNKFKPELLKSKGKNSFEPAEYLIYTDQDVQILTFNDIFMDVIVRDDNTLQSALSNKISEIKNKVGIYLKNANNISKNINKTILEENTKSLTEYIYSTMYRSLFSFILILLTVFSLFMSYIIALIGMLWNKLTGKITAIA